MMMMMTLFLLSSFSVLIGQSFVFIKSPTKSFFFLLFFFSSCIYSMSDAKQVSSRRYWGGILALSGVVLIWVTSSFAMNVNSVYHSISSYLTLLSLNRAYLEN